MVLHMVSRLSFRITPEAMPKFLSEWTNNLIGVNALVSNLFDILLLFFKWAIRSNHIKDFPVTVQDIDADLKIWGKNIAALKGKTTRLKMIPVARDYVKVPLELVKLKRYF
jgi:hypothetical protein